MIISIVHAFYVVLIDFHAMFDLKRFNKNSKILFVIPIMVTTIIMFLYEVWQVVKNGFWDYISDTQNWFDTGGQMLMLTYCIMDFSE